MWSKLVPLLVLLSIASPALGKDGDVMDSSWLAYKLTDGAVSTTTGQWVSFRGYTNAALEASGFGTATLQVFGSNAAEQPANTTDGVQLGSDITTNSFVQISQPVRWIKSKVSSYTSGTISLFGVFAMTGPATSSGGTASTVTANAGTNLNTSALLLEATFTGRVNTQGQKTMAASTPVTVASDQSAVKVDGSAVTQPVSGTVTANVGTSGNLALDATVSGTQPRNVTQFSGTNLSTGAGAGGLGIPRVTVSNDSNVLATQSGTWTVQPGNTANTTAWKVDGSAVTQPVSGTVSTTPPANASANIAQFGGTALSTGTGAGGLGVPRVTVSNDSTVILGAGSATIGALTANQTVAQATATSLKAEVVGPTADNAANPTAKLSVLSGVANAAAPTRTEGNVVPLRTNLAGDVAITLDGEAVVLGAGSATIGALTANQSVNAAQVAGTGTVTAAAGVQRVGIAGAANAALDAAQNAVAPANVVNAGCVFNTTLPTITSGNITATQCDSSGRRILGTGSAVIGALTANQSVNVAQIAAGTIVTSATGVQRVGIAGAANAALDAANNAAAPANVIVPGVETITASGSNPTSATSGNVRRMVADLQGNLFVRHGGPNIFTCRVLAITAITQCQAAPAAGLRAYVTDITFVNNTAGAQTIKLQFGTGTNCATGLTDLTAAIQFGATVGNYDHAYLVPPVPTAANAVCVTPSAATSVSATLTGFIAP